MDKADNDKQKLFLAQYGQVSGRLSRFILSLVWNKEEARDIASETVLIAFQKFDKIQSEQVFIFYLFSIASRLIKQYNRKKRLWGIFSKEAEHHGEGTVFISESGLDMEVLHQALNRLPAKEKEAIMLFEIAGFSLAEIKEIQKDSL
jgi:RNA polymerase sigma-70 factor (ECF subfamily)